MNTFNLVISSSDGDFFDGEAVMLSLRGVEGDIAVMAGHISLVTAVKPGKFRLTLPNGTVKEGSLESGLLMTAPERTILLSDSLKGQLITK